MEFLKGDKTKNMPNIKVETKIKRCVGAAVLDVEVGTTGARGGDSGHGCRAYLRLENHAGDMEFSLSKNGIEVRLGGDSELNVLIDALEFAVTVLRAGETHDDLPKMGSREFV